MCLLVIFVVVAYDALAVQHFSDWISHQLHCTGLHEILIPTVNFVPLTQKWDVFIVNDLIQMPGNLYHLIC